MWMFNLNVSPYIYNGWLNSPTGLPQYISIHFFHKCKDLISYILYRPSWIIFHSGPQSAEPLTLSFAGLFLLRSWKPDISHPVSHVRNNIFSSYMTESQYDFSAFSPRPKHEPDVEGYATPGSANIPTWTPQRRRLEDKWSGTQRWRRYCTVWCNVCASVVNTQWSREAGLTFGEWIVCYLLMVFMGWYSDTSCMMGVFHRLQLMLIWNSHPWRALIKKEGEQLRYCTENDFTYCFFSHLMCLQGGYNVLIFKAPVLLLPCLLSESQHATHFSPLLVSLDRNTC